MMAKKRCANKKCPMNRKTTTLWAGIFYNNKHYCLTCAEKKGLIFTKTEIHFNPNKQE
jgi:hypothetical protein